MFCMEVGPVFWNVSLLQVLCKLIVRIFKKTQSQNFLVYQHPTD